MSSRLYSRSAAASASMAASASNTAKSRRLTWTPPDLFSLSASAVHRPSIAGIAASSSVTEMPKDHQASVRSSPTGLPKSRSETDIRIAANANAPTPSVASSSHANRFHGSVS